jgi:hypothetical protein
VLRPALLLPACCLRPAGRATMRWLLAAVVLPSCVGQQQWQHDEWAEDSQLLGRVQQQLRSWPAVPREPSSSATAAEFGATYWETGRPVLLSGLVTAADWPALRRWSNRSAFVAAHGGAWSVARWPAGSHAFGVLGRRVQLADFVESMGHPRAGLLFHSSSIGSGEWEIPSALRVLESSSALRAGGILSVGASRQGLPFHYHGSTWEGVVQGRKLVVLVRAVTPDLSRGHDAVLRALLAPPTDDRLQLLAQVSGGWMAPSVTIPSHSLTHRTSAHRHAPQRPLSMTQSWGHAEANLLQSKSHVAPGTDWLWPVCWAELAI